MGKLDNQNVVIIGGTSGIGLATALMAQTEGANVWAVSRSREKVEQAGAKAPEITFQQADTHDIAALARLFGDVSNVDHIVAAATGAERTRAPFMDQTDEQFREAFNKFWGYTNVVRQGIPWLSERGSVTLVSGIPARKATPGMSSISCVGNAVEGLTRALALELAPKRVNVVAPGLINTGMFDHLGENKETTLAQLSQNIPLQRVGNPEEVAEAILLAMTNDYMTGATIDVDGGALLP